MSKLFGKRPSSEFKPSAASEAAKEASWESLIQGDKIIDQTLPEIVAYVTGTQDYQKVGERRVSADLAQLQTPTKTVKDVFNKGPQLQQAAGARMGAKVEGLATQIGDQLSALGQTQEVTTTGTKGLSMLGRMKDITKFQKGLDRGTVGAAFGNMLGTIGGAVAWKKANPD